MKPNFRKAVLKTAALAVTTLLTAGMAHADVTVNLTAQRASTTLPDGNNVPMWSFCQNNQQFSNGIPVTGTGSLCSTSGSGAWAPGPTISVPVGANLTIKLANSLPTPTSLVILGQIGGGLGSPVKIDSPVHSGQTNTTFPNAANASFTPPNQGQRARSFSPEAAVNGSQTYTWSNLKPGTYLYATGTHPSIQQPMGLYGVLIVTNAPAGGTAGQAYPGAYASLSSWTNVPYDADASLLLSEIDPVQNAAVDTTPLVNGSIDESQYPPAVNYAPRYYLINGQAFDTTQPSKSAFSIADLGTTGSSGNVLLRFVNAGVHSHTPTVPGLPLALIAEDGNVAPGKPKVQSEVLLAAGKAFDVLVKPAQTQDPSSTVTPGACSGHYAAAAYPVFDRQLNLANGSRPNGGQQAVLNVAGLGSSAGCQIIAVNGDGTTTAVAAAGGSLQGAASVQAVADTFIVPVNSKTFSNNVLSNDTGIGNVAVAQQTSNGTVTLNANGTFTYTLTTTPTPTGSVSPLDSFTYNGTGTDGKQYTATVTLNLAALSGAPTANADSYTSNLHSTLKVKRPGVLLNDKDPAGYLLTAVLDGNPAGVTLNADGSFTAPATLTSFNYHVVNAQGTASAPATVTLSFPAAANLNVTVQDTQDKTVTVSDYRWTIEEDTTFYVDPKNPSGTGTAGTGTTPPTSLGTSFHKSFMPLVATGCTGAKSCEDNQAYKQAKLTQDQIAALKKTSTFPSDVVLDPSKRYYISILPGDVSDPLTGANTFGHTMGGAPISGAQITAPSSNPVTVLVPRNPLPPAQLSVFVFEDNNPTNGDVDDNEAPLGGFKVTLWDTRGSSGDPAGQMTYDLSGMPLKNSLLGTPGCPGDQNAGKALPAGVIITCPNAPPIDPNLPPAQQQALAAQYATDYALAGLALIDNLMPGRFDVWAAPGADREGAGERWIQVSTLEGTPANDTFVKAGEPAYWQEFGSPGFHSFIGFLNPDRIKAVNQSLNGTGTVSGRVTNLHMDRPPAANLNDSCAGNNGVDCARAALSYTTCHVGLNSTAGTGANIAFAECDANGNFTLTGVPDGTYEVKIWDDWLDQIIAGKAVTVDSTQPNGNVVSMGDIPVFSWFTRLEESIYSDLNGNGVREDNEPGLTNLPMNVRFRDGSIASRLLTDSNGQATFNELFPLFNWYVLESDTTRFKATGVNITYDAGGPADTSGPYAGLLNSTESVSLPKDLKVPGAKYTDGTTNRIDPANTLTEGFQGFIGQTQILDWGKTPYNVGENGGITGMVYYASTRGFDDPRLEIQFSWEPAVARVPVNLYRETSNADGTTSLQLVDSTTTSSWDDAVANPATTPHCPGDSAADPFINWTLGAANQYKCYDGQHAFNQVQPAVYDGLYRFPSAAYTKNNPTGLPPGKYVVEVVPPAGYEIVKEEDKNILIGDAWIAPATTQFGATTNIFILPDQATLNNANVEGFGAAFPPCVGNLHTVPDYLSMVPEAQQLAPFAGQQRNLCDRKEVTLEDRMQALANFQVFTPAPIAGHFTGMMLNDAAAEFDPTNPSFGEKAALPNAPVSIRDYNGTEILRTYNDKWGTFNGLTPSTWEPNVPNPSGYSPVMLTTCMNDPGPIPDPKNPGQYIIDPSYNPMFSNFCYTWPFLPGITTYLDTPVLPVAAFASGTSYNPVDCQYSDATPAIKRVDGDGVGPWVSATGHKLTITALGDVSVLNPNYAGPIATSAHDNQPMTTRHYGFGTTKGTVTVGGVALTNVTWNDTAITGTVPPTAKTGELVITAANGKSSVDTVTVTIESKAPTVVEPVTAATPNPATNLGLAHPIQDAIDAAAPGDLIIVDAGSYPELVVMWKPVRLQGVGAASVLINAAKYPTTKIADWRTKVNGLFGLDNQGNQLAGTAAVDPLPGQEITGGIVRLEPSVLSTEEGPGITVLAKAYNTDGTTLLTNQDCGFAGNFLCAPSRIDGVSVTGGDAGGGVYVNGWAHNLEIANNRVYGNAGSVTGGVRIGQPFLEGQVQGVNGGLGYDVNVNIHHNNISTNGTVEANAAAGTAVVQGAAAGGLSLNAGSDNYKVQNNWVCGNFSSGDGGGISHLGLSLNGTISNNEILFNQSYLQASVTSGGGLAVEGEPASGTTLSLGTGNVTVSNNLIQGNFAQGGSGGGVRLQYVNGSDVVANPNTPSSWWRVSLTNNTIINNVAGWAGAGISMVDTLNSVLTGNKVWSNDSTGIAGVVINASVNGAPVGATTGIANPAGISTEQTSPGLLNAVPAANQATYGISSPTLNNNVIWRNRSFFYDGSSGTAKLIASSHWTDAASHAGNPLPDQSFTGQCVAGAQYWDLGVIGDASPTPGAKKLNPTNSVLSSTAGYTGAGNSSIYPTPSNFYCNGSRAKPEAQFEPGTPFQPPLNFSVSATLDESGNFVDLHYGPLSLVRQAQATLSPTSLSFGNVLIGTTSAAQTVTLTNTGNAGLTINTPVVAASAPFALASNTCTVGTVVAPGSSCSFSVSFHPTAAATSSATLTVTDTDPTPQTVALSGTGTGPVATMSASSLSFGTVQTGQTSTLPLTLSNTGTAPLSFTGVSIGAPGNAAANFTQTNNCPASLTAGNSCQINVSFTPSAANARTATLTVNVGAPATSPKVSLSGNGAAPSATLSPTPLAFGSQLLNTSSAAQTVTLSNTGIGALSISSITLPTGYTQTNTCGTLPATLAAGGTCTLSVTFSPATAGAKNGNLSVVTAAGTKTVALTGTGTAVAALPAQNFGTGVAAGQTSTRNVTVSNPAANGILSISTYSVTNTIGSAFSVGTPVCSAGSTSAAIIPGGNCAFPVTMTVGTPKPASNYTGTLTIVDNANSPLTAALSGR